MLRKSRENGDTFYCALEQQQQQHSDKYEMIFNESLSLSLSLAGSGSDPYPGSIQADGDKVRVTPSQKAASQMPIQSSNRQPVSGRAAVVVLGVCLGGECLIFWFLFS